MSFDDFVAAALHPLGSFEIPVSPESRLLEDLGLDSLCTLELLTAAVEAADDPPFLLESEPVFTMGDVYRFYLQMSTHGSRQ